MAVAVLPTFQKCLFQLKKLTDRSAKYSDKLSELNRSFQQYKSLQDLSIKELVEYVESVKQKYPTEWQEQLDKEIKQEELIAQKNAEYEAKQKAKEPVGELGS